MIWILVCLIICCIIEVKNAYKFTEIRRFTGIRSLKILNCQKNWYDRQEEVLEIQADDTIFNVNGKSLFDSLYDISEKSATVDSSHTDISKLSLRDISEAYSFSLDYLGDFVVQIGCRPPINIDEKLGNLLTGDQIYSIMEAINTLDPFDTNVDYDSVSLQDLADDLEISEKRILSICERVRVNLPFGMDSVLHKSCVDSIFEIVSLGDFSEDEEIDEVLDVNYNNIETQSS